MKKVLVVTLTDLDPDPRAIKQAVELSTACNVYYCSVHDPKLSGITHIPLAASRLSTLQKIVKYLLIKIIPTSIFYFMDNQIKSFLSATDKHNFDVIIANDLESIPAALKIKSQGRAISVIGDLHEYSPEEFENKTSWRFFIKPFKLSLCKKYLSQCDFLLTVGPYIAKKFKQNFGVEMHIVYNAPTAQTITPKIREDDRIKLVHVGGAMRHRKIEKMIELMKHLDDRFTLDLFLVGSKDYINELKVLCRSTPSVKFPDAVPNSQVASTLNDYDIGIYILNPDTVNDEYCLPNKFFEFIHARIAVGISPNPEMKHLVEKYELGVIADNYQVESLALRLKQLSKPQIMKFKENANIAAEELSFEKSFLSVKDMILRLT